MQALALAAVAGLCNSGASAGDGAACEVWQPLADGLGGIVTCLTVYDGEVVAGGTTIAGKSGSLARWNGATWQPLGNPGGNGPQPPAIFALAVYNDDLIAGGRFVSIGGQPAANIARWDGSSWQPLGTGLAGNAVAAVTALAIYNGDLIAAGHFDSAGGQPAISIARWDGSSWHAMGSGLTVGPTFPARMSTLIVYDGDLIAGGGLTHAGGQEARNIARWDGSSWHALGEGVDGTTWSLAEYAGDLIVGGDMSNAGGVPAQRLARWDGATWHSMGSASGSVRAMAIYNEELVAAGWFGAETQYVIRWDGATWQPLGGLMDNAVFALTVESENLIAGGWFTHAEGESANFIASLTACASTCSADIAGAMETSDGVVNLFDLLELLANWGSDGPGAALAPSDDVVDLFDLLALLALWGPCE